MELTKEQMEFLDRVCVGTWELNSNGEVDVVNWSVSMYGMNLTEIPVKFGRVRGDFLCYENQLITLKNAPTSVEGSFSCSNNKLTSLEFAPKNIGELIYCYNNNLTNYFKNIKEEDFPHWDKLNWVDVLKEYPFLINICKKNTHLYTLKQWVNIYPQTKLYLE